ncbi:MAG: ATP-binding protein [Candidatus Thiodiazotropha taylori]|nr:ATP-binding protein [Candidatus Thiodiazotropha taylori]MCW4226762.1 ATP-binding protein [Candidatus Thiodiazotropha endolucinida]MCG7888324.1 ATP-binding protein [Candidatus Thiodiazotropha taylori]MCG7890753.1 ATP-binding protein [Candidatus Thiodiazotropha taylori]MCG8032704.1 ATP-binding protein [Candidatus Thiodiazotropha taylori]
MERAKKTRARVPERNRRSPLHFKVSSYLKTIIGRDLITDDLVAVFELVKNAFDARATRVDLVFLEEKIYVIDNGKGMTLGDITNKWLFVAYSAKQDDTEDADLRGDYRGKLNAKRESFAGNKGVGRFSCDRLGSYLKLQTRSVKRGSKVEVVDVDWTRFDENSKEEFRKINIHHKTSTRFELDDTDVDPPSNGTIIEITQLGSLWDQAKLLKLKSSLAKLVNPLGTRDDIKIWIHAPAYIDTDIEYGLDPSSGEISDKVRATDPDGYAKTALKIVNGIVKNPVFDLLVIKTTSIRVHLSRDAKKITTEMTDRGDLLYKIKEPNPYKHLKRRTRIAVELFYLNRAAKANFTRRMGINQTQFGHVFLFYNGFRVYPVGEPENDEFGLDKRKAQGYARFLGTRDLIGRIDVWGEPRHFRESSSRDAGLVQTPAYEDLENLFFEKVIKRLEAYVTGVIWEGKDEEEKNRESSDSIRSREDLRAKVIGMLSKLVDNEDVELLDYNPSFLDVMHERSLFFEPALEGIKLVAGKANDRKLLRQIKEAEKRFNELKKAEAEARQRVLDEQEARKQAEARALEEQQKAETTRQEKAELEKALSEERKRVIFHRSIASIDTDKLLNLHHQIKTYSYTIENHLTTMQRKLDLGRKITEDDIRKLLDRISFTNRKVKLVTEIATRANFRVDAEEITEDISSYIEQYANTIGKTIYNKRLKITTVNNAHGFEMAFKPIEVSMMVDNLLDNARKSRAKKVDIVIESKGKKAVSIKVSDNGDGFSETIENPDRVFEKGFTTTRGSGLGLYHVSEVVKGLGGTITAFPNNEGKGAIFEVKIRK